ncbi:uncharacterized protein C2845_PM02G22040 [Panicum miliaceum]|uniref:Uncharacterized protein n=1 Tax=Panicum miliaceum TaxID=4540 RepID=A0A3L6SFU6_PANMI|nr:uncharacterized protein C2845_PM02G22040 [Panicum miliaceum]
MPGAVEAEAGRRRPTASERRRMYRDLALALRCGLRSTDADTGLFRDSQTIRDLQVVPVLFEHSLRKATGDAVVTVAQVLGMEPAAARLRSPATDSEVVLALRVLQGCCLLCPACAAAAHRYDASRVVQKLHCPLLIHQVVLNILMTRGILEQRACLDTLLALLVDCFENQMDFKEQDGLNKIADIVKDSDRDDHVSSTLESQVRQSELSFLAEQDQRLVSSTWNVASGIKDYFNVRCMSEGDE